MEKHLVGGHIEYQQHAQALAVPLNHARRAAQHLAIKVPFTIFSRGQLPIRLGYLVQFRQAEQNAALAIKDQRGQVAMPAKHGVQLWSHGVEALQVAESEQQLFGGNQLISQGLAIQLVEMVLAELIEQHAGKRQHAGDGQHK
ncbi:hypothetical protein D3C77_397550 [compost metagenome]